MAKPENNTTPAQDAAQTTPIAITTASIKKAIMDNVTFLEMKTGKEAACSATQYASVLFLTMVDLQVVPADHLDDMMSIWAEFPKSPSAFRQVLEKEDKVEEAKKSAGLMAKYAAKSTPA